MSRIVLHGAVTPGFVQSVRTRIAPDVVLVAADDVAGLAAALTVCEILLHVLTPFTARDIAAAPKLRLIQKIGVGVNTIDVAAASARGVAVCNMPGSNSRAVAEAVLALMFAVLRRVPVYDRSLRAGQWQPRDPSLGDTTGEVAGRTVGLVGYGRSAQLLAPILRAIGAEVIYTATAPHDAAPEAFRSLDDLIAQADIVSLHVPLTEATRGLLNAARIAAMKPGAVLINVARGELVDEAALAEALASGHLRGAGLDVFTAEPLASDSPLLALPNTVVMPHVAWLTPETLDRSLVVIAENVRRLDYGEPLLHRVN